VNLAGIRRVKWAQKTPLVVRKAMLQAPCETFRTVSEDKFSEVRGSKLGRSGGALRTWTGTKRYSRTSPNRSSGKSTHEMLHNPGPMPQGQAALTFGQGGTPPEGPPSPSKPVSKHMPPAKKTPIRVVYKDWSKCYDFGVESGLPLSPSEAARLSSCPIAPVLCDGIS